ncbi:hypothetical protein FDG96_gp19 [Bacillus phage Mgbh1]|uniref:Uncharacterized protein n=1 Tax=Bacillus phage Mgbh1 TaxID=1796993 RepID=A0A142F1M1_9CAUD|nr:hypothetical protein FDG96_gp19 [Bacillus phage Mgbh1]AMQ66678.1 hypothetical protein [Bacillus phage Mgbh1]
MKIRTVKAVVNGNKVGSVIDLPQKEAEYLIRKGVAEKVEVEKGTSAPKKTSTRKRTSVKETKTDENKTKE